MILINVNYNNNTSKSIENMNDNDFNIYFGVNDDYKDDYSNFIDMDKYGQRCTIYSL